MKAIFTSFVLIAASIFLSSSIFGQRFVATTPLPINLNNGTTNYTSCSVKGNKPTVSFNVSVPQTSLNSTFALASIDLSFDLGCGVNYRDLQLFLVDPTGTKCMSIYSHLPNAASIAFYEGTIAGGTFNVSMRDASCLSIPDISPYPCGQGACFYTLSEYHQWALNTNKTGSGNHGVFKANSTTNMSSFFSGTNPNGTWTIYASETSTTFSPCISAASITFGNPTVSDQSAVGVGEDCNSAITWSGQSICASTTGKTGSLVSPGYYDGPKNNDEGFVANIGNAPCLWNAANNNDVWVKFTPTANPSGAPVCISISGLTGRLQSVIVTDLNADVNNLPCTQTPSGSVAKSETNDPFWQVVSCPSSGGASSIYQLANGGTSFNQQHCFLPVPGKTYYMIVDGTGGVQSPFFITGISGPLQAILPTTGPQQSFVSNTRKESETPVTMTGGLLKTNAGNKKFNQQIRIYDSFGNLIYSDRRTATGFTEMNLYPFMRMGFNVIKIKDDQGGDYTFKLLK